MAEEIQQHIDQAALDNFGEKIKVKDCQSNCIKSVIRGKNTLGVLPTGYGKTLIYQLLPSVVAKMNSKQTILIIVCPLEALMNEQIERCQTFGTAVKLTEPFSEDVKNGKIQFLFSSPEIFMSEPCRTLFLSEIYQENVMAIVVDEAHTVVKW